MAVSCRWRGDFDNAEVSELHAEAFDHAVVLDDWWGQVQRHSLGWACARDGATLVGFVNVAWDGGVHAFLLDTMVAAGHRRQGIGTDLVATVVAALRGGSQEWLHVDFDARHRGFYLDACGFSTAAGAGLIDLA